MNLNFTLKACMALFAGMLTVSSYGQTPPAKKFGKHTELLKCGTVEYENYLNKKSATRKSTAGFEQWLAPKVEAAKQQNFFKNGQAIITIPVVVHVIHSGVPVGTDENISEGQILSQIQVLNEDFRRMLGTNGYNENPLGADVEVNFCLAQRDPNGLLSNGITRHVMTSETGDGWDMTEVEENVKPQTQWDPEQYLNIWVLDYITVQGFFELAGYAQFPTDSGLEGLVDPSMPAFAETDGVAIGYLYFGSEEIYPAGSYDPDLNLGRTTTHEVGHYLGLRHIWGDGDPGMCNGTDYCDDTPAADQANQGCPTGLDSCDEDEELDMIANYMDYTDDACKNIFTQDQKNRIAAVLANSPRRASLATSLGCTPGMVYDNDGSLQIEMDTQGCTLTAAPSIILTNTGNNTLTSVTISYNYDVAAALVYEWEGSLANGESSTIELPEMTLAGGEHTVTAIITAVNGGEDEVAGNNTASFDFEIVMNHITTGVIVNLTTDDFGDETYWAVVDSDENPIIVQGPLESNETYTMEVELESGCYAFGIIDFAGDGMCCDYGNGSYEVTTMEGVVIAQGGQFGESEITKFEISSTMGNDDFSAVGDVKLYPNPTNGILNIKMPNSELPESYTIYNNIGQVIASSKVSIQSNLSIDTAAYSNGIYFIKIVKDGAAQTLKFIKN